MDYVVLYGLCACALCKLQFDRVKGQVRDPSLNSMLLLTSSIYLQSFIILRLLILVKPTDRQTDIQDDRIKHSYGILNNTLYVYVPLYHSFVPHLLIWYSHDLIVNSQTFFFPFKTFTSFAPYTFCVPLKTEKKSKEMERKNIKSEKKRTKVSGVVSMNKRWASLCQFLSCLVSLFLFFLWGIKLAV